VSALFVFVGGACGAALRACVCLWLPARFPWAILLVNTAGSFLAGIFAACALSQVAAAFLLTGFCGGMSTYSSFALDTARLFARSKFLALLNVFLNGACGLAGAGIGWSLGRLV